MKNQSIKELENRCEEMTKSLVEFYIAGIKLNSSDLGNAQKGTLIHNLIINTFPYFIADLSLLTSMSPYNFYKTSGFNKEILRKLNEYDIQFSKNFAKRFAKNES